MVPAAHVEGLYGCLDYYQTVSDPFSKTLLAQYNARYPGTAKFTGGSACSGLYRGLKLWEAAVKEAGSLGRTTSSRRSITPRSPKARAVPPRWCPASITFA